MKPRLKRILGLWYCATPLSQGPAIGLGYTPSDAYLDWRRWVLATGRESVVTPAQPTQEVQRIPAEWAPDAADPHAELRKTWQPGQRWQVKPEGWLAWNDLKESCCLCKEGGGIWIQPDWFPHCRYRRHPEDAS